MSGDERSAMRDGRRGNDAIPLLTFRIQTEADVVGARQRARQIGALLGFDVQQQTRLATAVSEIARNAVQYAGGGRIDFVIEGHGSPQNLLIRVLDSGPGIARSSVHSGGPLPLVHGNGPGDFGRAPPHGSVPY